MDDSISMLRQDAGKESQEYRTLRSGLWITRLAVLLVALAALAGLYYSTLLGPGIGGDATIYITSARNLIAGKGFGLIGPQGEFRLLPYFAPFFSLVLSGLGLLGADMVQGARWLNMLMFSALVYLAGTATYRVSRSVLFGVLAALVLACSPILIPIFSWAMSEPLALFLGFAGLWLALVATRTDRVNTAFIGSALLTGLSFLTRYSSAAFIGAAVLALLVFRPRRFMGKLGDAILYGILAALPTGVWLGLDYYLTQAVSSRSVESQAGMAERLSHFWPQVVNNVLVWLVPFSWIDAPRYPAALNRLLPYLFLFGLALWLVVALVFALRKRSNIERGDERVRWAVTLVFLALIYLALILAVYVTTYPPITIDNRMLSPFHIALLWLAVVLASLTASLFPAARRAIPTIVLGLGVLLFAAWFGWRSYKIVAINSELGLGYSSREWQNSQTLAALRDLPADAPIVTNETAALLYLTGRNAFPFREVYQNAPSAVFSRYGEGDLSGDPGQQLFREGKAPLVLFDTISGQYESIYGGRTAERIQALTEGLRQAFKGSDGAIYYYAH